MNNSTLAVERGQIIPNTDRDYNNQWAALIISGEPNITGKAPGYIDNSFKEVSASLQINVRTSNTSYEENLTLLTFDPGTLIYEETSSMAFLDVPLMDGYYELTDSDY